MQQIKSLKLLILMLLGMFACLQVNAILVKQFNLGEMTNNADKIFRGTVVQIQTGTITVGGGELPTVKYVIQVSDTLKGDFSSSAEHKAGSMIELTMLGHLKAPATQEGIQFAGGFRPPLLQTNREYLLFTTSPSSIGLSMTVGVGQGVFSFTYGNNVINEAKNAGLFRDMDRGSMPLSGPVPYVALAEQIKSLTGKKEK